MPGYKQLSLFLYGRIWPINALCSLAGLYFVLMARHLEAALLVGLLVKACGFFGSFCLYHLRSSGTYLFYRNFGLSVRRLFAIVFLIDLALFSIVFFTAAVCKP